MTKFDSLERELSVTLRKMNDRILEIRQETGSIVNTMPLLTMLEAAVLRLRGARVEFHKVVNQKDHQPLLRFLGKSAIAALERYLRYQAPHIRPPISGPPYQTPHIKPPISDPPYQYEPPTYDIKLFELNR